MRKYFIICLSLATITIAHQTKECLLKGVCDVEPFETHMNLTVSECMQTCMDLPSGMCQWSTYIKYTKICLLYSECPSISSLLGDSVTSRAGCLIPSRSYLMVTNGHNGNFEKDLPTEVIDLVFPITQCQTLPFYPYATHGSAMGFLKDGENPAVCGGLGYSENGYHQDVCYKIDLETSKFIQDEPLIYPRVYSGGSFVANNPIVGEGIFFSGGYPLGSNASKTTERILDQGNIHQLGPDLPIPRRSHCSVSDMTNQNNDFWIIGGRIGETENKTYSGVVTSGTLHFDENYENWIEGPSLIQSRELHVCEVMKMPGSSDVIVVAGGRDANETVLTSVEFFVNGAWIQGPDLPKPLYEPTMVSFGSTGVILMGGTFSIQGPSSSSIYRLACGESLQTCEWIEMEQKLSADRYGHNSLLISEGHGALSCI